MSNSMLAIVPTGDCHGCKQPRNDSYGGAEDTMYLRLLEEKAKNRVMGVQLECANALLRVREEKREAKKRVRKAALKLLGWLGFGFGWGVLAVACSVFAPWWTCIAPVCLMLAAWWKAGGEV